MYIRIIIWEEKYFEQPTCHWPTIGQETIFEGGQLFNRHSTIFSIICSYIIILSPSKDLISVVSCHLSCQLSLPAIPDNTFSSGSYCFVFISCKLYNRRKQRGKSNVLYYVLKCFRTTEMKAADFLIWFLSYFLPLSVIICTSLNLTT